MIISKLIISKFWYDIQIVMWCTDTILWPRYYDCARVRSPGPRSRGWYLHAIIFNRVTSWWHSHAMIYSTAQGHHRRARARSCARLQPRGRSSCDHITHRICISYHDLYVYYILTLWCNWCIIYDDHNIKCGQNIVKKVAKYKPDAVKFDIVAAGSIRAPSTPRGAAMTSG